MSQGRPASQRAVIAETRRKWLNFFHISIKYTVDTYWIAEDTLLNLSTYTNTREINNRERERKSLLKFTHRSPGTELRVNYKVI